MSTPDPEILKRKAIAIKGSEAADTAPSIAAKGQGYVAERILDIAFAEGVKVRQDEDLTNILEAFEVDSPVPLEALNTVGLILERVYQENQKLQDQQHATPENSPSMKDITPGSGDQLS